MFNSGETPADRPPSLAPHFVGPALIGAAAFGSGALVLLRRSYKNSSAETTLGNPFELAPLALFAGAFALVALLSAWATQRSSLAAVSEATIGEP